MRKYFVLFLSLVFFFGCSNSTTRSLITTEESEDKDTPAEDGDIQPDEDEPAEPEPDDDAASDAEQIDESDSETEEPDPEIPDIEPENQCENVDPVFCFGGYNVNIFDVAAGTDGAPRNFRVYEPIGAEGKLPVVHFLHGFMYRYYYYDNFLMQLSSHGFIVVSSQSTHKMRNGDTTTQEAEKVTDFLNWLKENLQSKLTVTADFENFGVSGHSRGGKVTNRVLNSNPTIARSFFGVDPVDSPPPFSNFVGDDDPYSLNDPVQFAGESMFLGTEKGPDSLISSLACAPSGGNSTNFYAQYPSPSHHIIAAGVGHTDMVDQEDVKACSVYCSTCAGSNNNGMKLMFITYTGGLMTAFFNSTLKGLTEYEELLNDPSEAYPFMATVVEHK